jgi:hypothetical protein
MATRLLSHYWAGDEPEAVRQAQIEDWITDLVEFPLHVVADMCQRWRQTETRRPLPTDIRRLCIETISTPPKDEASWTETEIMRRADTWAQAHDYDSIAAFQQAGKSAHMWLPKGKRRYFPADRPGESEDYSKTKPLKKPFRFTKEELEDRAEWAKIKGYPSWNDFLDAIRHGPESILPFHHWVLKKRGIAPAPPVRGFASLGEGVFQEKDENKERLRREAYRRFQHDLGITMAEQEELDREVEKVEFQPPKPWEPPLRKNPSEDPGYTAAQMAAARKALGLPE